MKCAINCDINVLKCIGYCWPTTCVHIIVRHICCGLLDNTNCLIKTFPECNITVTNLNGSLNHVLNCNLDSICTRSGQHKNIIKANSLSSTLMVAGLALTAAMKIEGKKSLTYACGDLRVRGNVAHHPALSCRSTTCHTGLRCVENGA